MFDIRSAAPLCFYGNKSQVYFECIENNCKNVCAKVRTPLGHDKVDTLGLKHNGTRRSWEMPARPEVFHYVRAVLVGQPFPDFRMSQPQTFTHDIDQHTRLR